MSPALGAEIFGFLQKERKEVYKAALQGLANQRNLRSVFIERKPPAERYPWIQAALSRPMGELVGAHLLQAWLLGAKAPMLRDFLGSLGIAHAEDGTVDTIPASPPKEEIASAVEALLGKYPAESVAVYLHVFRGMDSASDWPALREILDEDPRLKLQAANGGL